MQALVDEAVSAGVRIAIPAGALAQAWRGTARQARIALLLRLSIVMVVALDEVEARSAGVLCGRAGTADVVDASVVICARGRGHAVVTSDRSDRAVLDPTLRLVSL